MFCSNCGTKLPDDANFCLKCGRPQKSGVVTDEPKWEMCKIVGETVKDMGFFSKGVFRLRAQAFGPTGTYTAGRSTTWENHPGAGPIGRALDGLVNQLLTDGWEATGNYGSSFTDLQFRRRVK